jgi:hypothetical protein
MILKNYQPCAHSHNKADVEEITVTTEFHRLLQHPELRAQRELDIETALDELSGTLPVLEYLARCAEAGSHKNGVHITRLWNPLVKTYTYHTHVVVPGITADALERVTEQFFNAYALQKQVWYSQFISGASYPLPKATEVAGRHQIGQGFFDFGVPGLRVYHTLFSKVELSKQVPSKTELSKTEISKSASGNSQAVVLRTVNTPMVPLQPAKQVYLLPPTGDVFTIDAAGLHWHHICTTNGVRVLPGILDAWLMNILRFANLDQKERETYTHEGEGFIAFVRTL